MRMYLYVRILNSLRAQTVERNVLHAKNGIYNYREKLLMTVAIKLGTAIIRIDQVISIFILFI